MSDGARIAELLRQVRADTLQLLEATRAEEPLWAPFGTANQLLWHAAHALGVGDALCVRPLAGASELPADWAAASPARKSFCLEWRSNTSMRSSSALAACMSQGWWCSVSMNHFAPAYAHCSATRSTSTFFVNASTFWGSVGK